MKQLILIFLLAILGSCDVATEKESNNEVKKIEYDSHVHIMSPELIAYWKKLGIPFSKSEANYSNVDTILANSQAKQLDLIGMGYVYGNPEYYEGNDVKERIMAENNFLFKAAKKYPKKIKPFFAIAPLNDSAIPELERCYQLNPNSGLKLHFNASQVYLTEPEHLEKIKKIFSKCANLELPILLHFDNWHPKFGKPDIEILVDSILATIPTIKLQIAHFGTSGGFNKKTKNFIDAFTALKNKTPARHQIVFDISAVALDKDSEGVSKLTAQEFKELRSYIDKLGIENIVFGTDYPLYRGLEYLNVLKEKVGLTDDELERIMKKSTVTK